MQRIIALIEEDLGLRTVLQNCLVGEGYSVVALSTAASFSRFLFKQPVDLIVVDIGLAGIDGLALARFIRERSEVAVIIVGEHKEPMDRVVWLELGADDFVIKPFEPRELLARARNILRHKPHAEPNEARVLEKPAAVVFGGWTFDLLSRALFNPSGAEIRLTSTEYSLLETFVRRPNRILSRAQLIDYVYENHAPAIERSIDVTVARLRKKLDDDSTRGTLIKTVRNCGYIFAAKVAAPEERKVA